MQEQKLYALGMVKGRRDSTCIGRSVKKACEKDRNGKETLAN